MSVVTIIDVYEMTPEEYRRVMDTLGVEKDPEPGIYLHLTAKMDFGYRVVEIWDEAQHFQDFMTRRLAPAAEKAEINRRMEVQTVPLHNFFGPRLDELPGLIASLPGRPAELS
jgi:hypothetical protein